MAKTKETKCSIPFLNVSVLLASLLQTLARKSAFRAAFCCISVTETWGGGGGGGMGGLITITSELVGLNPPPKVAS